MKNSENIRSNTSMFTLNMKVRGGSVSLLKSEQVICNYRAILLGCVFSSGYGGKEIR